MKNSSLNQSTFLILNEESGENFNFIDNDDPNSIERILEDILIILTDVIKLKLSLEIKYYFYELKKIAEKK